MGRIEHIGDATLYLGDCLPAMREMTDNAFDLAIVDPPYGINVDGKNPIANKSGDQNHQYDHTKQWDTAIPPLLYFEELMRVSKNQIIWGGNYYLDILGFCKAPIIWDKLNGESMFADGEMAWTSPGLPRNLKIFRHQWCGAFKDSERGEIKIHPTQKPVALYKWLLSKYAKPGDRILDTHLGSGSSVVAYNDAGFPCMAYEIDEDYFNAAYRRIADAYKQPRLFEDEKPTPKPQNLFEEADK